MRSTWRVVMAAAAALAVGSPAFASTVYTDGFESGYADGDNLLGYPNWFCDSRGGAYSPVVEATSGLAGTYGLGQAQNPFTWKAQSFDWSNPAVTKVVIGVDLESTWIPDGQTLETYKPFDDDMLGWTVVGDSTSSSDIFGVHIEGNEVRSRWRKADGSTVNTVMATIPGYVEPLAWFRLRVEYTKLTDTSLRMDVSLTALDSITGAPGDLVASGTVADTDTALSSASKRPAVTDFVGPMWVKQKNYNSSSGNADNFYLEVVPEPATLILAAGGGLLLIRRRSGR